MYLVRFHARKPPKKLALRYGGAYVNFYIELPDGEQAARTARESIMEQGWAKLRRIGIQKIRRKELEGTTGIELFDQALIDKCVFQFHTYPPERLRSPRRTQ